MDTLAFYIYPIPHGTNYNSNDLSEQEKVLELFNYCQIFEAIIYKQGWDFLINHYGYEQLFSIDKESCWFDCQTIKEFISCINSEKENATVK